MKSALNPKGKQPVGRPTKMTDVVIGKLEEAFALDATVGEACFFAGIHPDTYYEYLKANPEFTDRVKALRETPILAARRKVISGIKEDTKNAQWYLERKRKDEFSPRTELADPDGKGLFAATRLEVVVVKPETKNDPTTPENSTERNTASSTPATE